MEGTAKNFLRKARKAGGFTLEYIAQLTKIPVPRLRALEEGAVPLEAEIATLCAIYGIERTALYFPETSSEGVEPGHEEAE